METKADYLWMAGTCYEPPYQRFAPHRRRARFWRLFAVAATLIVISGALAGLSH